jgi:hypothetical protein
MNWLRALSTIYGGDEWLFWFFLWKGNGWERPLLTLVAEARLLMIIAVAAVIKMVK